MNSKIDFLESSFFESQRKKIKLIEFREQFMIGNFKRILTQLRKIDQYVNFLLVTFTLSLLDIGISNFKKSKDKQRKRKAEPKKL